MSANNSFTLVGNLTKKPEIGKTKNDKSYCFVNIAVNGIKDKPDFFSVCVWEKLAETIVKYCNKGDCVAFTGVISSQSKNGNTTTILTAQDAKFIYKAKKNEESKPVQEDKPFEPENDSFVTPDIFAPV